MSTESLLTPPEPLYVQIEQARQDGLSIHEMPHLTPQLAGHGLYTTKEPRDPESFIEFQETIDRERAMETIAQRVGSLLSRTSQYKEAVREGILGTALSDTFGDIVHVEGEDVHVAESPFADKTQAGIATAKSMRFTVANEQSASKLSTAFQALLGTPSPTESYSINKIAGTENTSPVVEIENFDEHAARSVSRSLQAVVAQENKAQGFKLPPDKYTLKLWKENGETFPPEHEARLQKISDDYDRLPISASYRDYRYMNPRVHKRMIGTDPAAALEAMRDIFGSLIKQVRGGSHFNLEQHPDESMRPNVEQGIILKRRAVTQQDIQYGPVSGHTPTYTEKGINLGKKLVTSAKKNPVATLLKGAAKVIGTGTEVALELLPAGYKEAKQRKADLDEWQKRKEAVEASNARLDRLANRLRRQAEGLPVWSEES